MRVGSYTRLSAKELIVVLEKNHESPLDSKEIKPVNSKGTQYYGFSSSHVRVGSYTRLSAKELIVVLEKNHESPLDSKEIKPVNSKGNQS